MFSQFFCSSLHFQAPTEWQPIDKGNFNWSSQTAMPGERVVFALQKPTHIQHLEIPSLWTDVSTDHFRADISFLTDDGTWAPIHTCTTNINYPKASTSNIPPKAGFADVYETTEKPLNLAPKFSGESHAIAITFHGHGWFGMAGLPTISGVCTEKRANSFYCPAMHCFLL